jgi:hypothetical protein
LISKFEKGERKTTKQLLKLAEFFIIHKKKDLLIDYSDVTISDLKDIDYANDFNRCRKKKLNIKKKRKQRCNINL